MDSLQENKVQFKNPFVSLNNPKTLFHVLKDEFKEFHVSDKELKHAIDRGFEELKKCQQDIRQEGQKAMEYMRENHMQGSVSVSYTHLNFYENGLGAVILNS